MKLYLNHGVMGWNHTWGRVPLGVAPEEIEVELPEEVFLVETHGGEMFEFRGNITDKVINKNSGNGWPRPYLLFVVDNKPYYKYFKLPEEYEDLMK